MTEKEVTQIMAVIQSEWSNAFPTPNETRKLWVNLLVDEEAVWYQKAVKWYIKGNPTGFAPKLGQLTEKAAEIRRTEWEEHQRKTDQLPAPESKREPMPDYIRRKMDEVFGRRP